MPPASLSVVSGPARLHSALACHAMTLRFLLHVVLPVLLFLSIAIWGAASLGFSSAENDDDWKSSALMIALKKSPPWWRSFTKWFLVIWTLLFITLLLSGKLIGA